MGAVASGSTDFPRSEKVSAPPNGALRHIDGLNIRNIRELREDYESEFEPSNPARLLEDILIGGMSGVIVFSAPSFMRPDEPDKKLLRIEAMYAGSDLENLLKRDIKEEIRHSLSSQVEQANSGIHRLVVVANKLPVLHARLQGGKSVVVVSGDLAEFQTQNDGPMVNSGSSKLFESLMDVALTDHALRKGEPAKTAREIVRAIKGRTTMRRSGQFTESDSGHTEIEKKRA